MNTAMEKDLVCRLCMKSEDVILYDIFNGVVPGNNENKHISISLKIMGSLNLEVDPDDGISNYVCHRCVHSVNSFYDFKERCKRVYDKWSEKIRKQNLNMLLKEDISYGYGSEDMKTDDEPAVLLSPTIGSEHYNLKYPLALSDSESNDMSISEGKPGNQVQEKRTDDLIRKQHENRQTVKQQTESFKTNDVKDNTRPEVVKESVTAQNEPAKATKEPVKITSHKRYCRLCHRSIPSEQFAKHHLYHKKQKHLSTFSHKKNKFQKNKRITLGGKQMYCCDICAKNFATKNSLQHHMLLHQAKDILKTKNVHQCPVCNKCYSISSHLNKHMILHTGERPYNCPTCSHTFCDNSDFIKHDCIHHLVKPFKCPLCPAEFQFKQYLKKHFAHHLNDRTVNSTLYHDCYTKELQPDDQLATVYTNKTLLRKHLFSLHADTSSDENVSDTDNDEVISINIDDAVPSTSQQQQQQQQQQKAQPEEDDHTDTERSTVDLSFTCRNCQTVCPTYSELVEHRKIHSGVSGIRCSLCKSLFKSQSAHTRHITSSHFKCSTCDKVFLTKLLCQMHEKEHKSANRNTCNICDKIFLSIDALSKHMMKHNLEAPFKCVLCSSECSSRTLLHVHYKVCCRQMKQATSAKK